MDRDVRSGLGTLRTQGVDDQFIVVLVYEYRITCVRYAVALNSKPVTRHMIAKTNICNQTLTSLTHSPFRSHFVPISFLRALLRIINQSINQPSSFAADRFNLVEYKATSFVPGNWMRSKC